MNVAVLTDSTSDLTPSTAQELGVDVVPLYVNFRGQVLKDGLEIRTHQIFEGVSAGAGMPSTSQPTPADFEAAYARRLEAADHLLSIHISSRLSGTIQSATLAARSFPGRVSVVDSKSASAGLGMMVDRAVRLLRAGASPDGAVAELERVRDLQDIRFGVATLDFLRKNGRIGGAQALIGSLLNIKPILRVADGRVEPAGRARGTQRAMHEIAEAARSFAARHGSLRLAYMYSESPDEVAPLRELLSPLGAAEFTTGPIGAVIASHTGPGTYGVCLEPLEA